MCQFKKVDCLFDFFIIDFSIVSGYVPKVFYKFFLRYYHSTSACLRKCLPRLCSESSPETTRLPPPQLTPNRSLTCLGLPDFAFSAVFPSFLSPFFPPLSLFCFSFENSYPKPARKRPRTPLLLRPPRCLTRPVADSLNELLFVQRRFFQYYTRFLIFFRKEFSQRRFILTVRCHSLIHYYAVLVTYYFAMFVEIINRT